MSTGSSIEWTDATWNVVTGCDRVSPGCDNCYALTMAKRLKAMGSDKYQRDGDPRTSGPGFGVTEHPPVLLEPFKWRKPRRVFVNSMSDLFHPHITSDFIASVWAVMALTPQHTYQVLTKRPRRARTLLGHPGHFEAVTDEMLSIAVGEFERGDMLDTAHSPWAGPLPNVWLGVSTEDQRRADERIPALLDTPAAVRWISAEPLLGPIDLDPWLPRPLCADCTAAAPEQRMCDACYGHASARGFDARTVQWVVTGGESGPGARPMHPDWARSLRDQCADAGVAFHFKQWGEFIHNPSMVEQWMGVPIHAVASVPGLDPYEEDASVSMWRVGKKRAGRELDGRTHDQYPEVRRA